MKNIFYIVLGSLIATGFSACQKESVMMPETTSTALIERSETLTQSQFDSLAIEVLPLDVWTITDLQKVISIENCDPVLMSVSDKYSFLVSKLGTRSNDPIETIVRKSSGNPNINGGAAYWDCNLEILAMTIAQIGQTCDVNAPNNYHNTSTGATVINYSDVIRAANGVSNTAFNDLINIEDIVYIYPLSGDGNWIVDVTLTYNGEYYIFSDALYNSGELIEGVTIGQSLIYDPIDGGLNGISIVGPMPGGITTILGTGLWPEPPVIE